MTKNSKLIDQLHKFVQYASKVTAKRTTLPILTYVCIENGTARATDLETTVVVPVDIKGSFAIPFHILKKVMSTKPETFSIEHGEGWHKKASEYAGMKKDVIKYDGKKLEYFSKDADEFPNIAGGEFKGLGNWTRSVIEQLIITARYCSGDELKPALNGIYIKQSEQLLEMCGTDGHKLRFIENIKVGDGEFEGVIDKKWLKMITKKALASSIAVMSNAEKHTAPDGDGDNGMKVTIASCLKVCFDGVEIYSRITDERYPDFKSVIPGKDKIKGSATIDTAECVEMVKEALNFCNRITHQGAFAFNEDKLTLTTDDPETGMHWENSTVAKIVGEPIKIGYNMDYLKRTLSDIEAETFELQYGREVSAAIIKAELVDGGNMTSLIMPIRLND